MYDHSYAMLVIDIPSPDATVETQIFSLAYNCSKLQAIQTPSKFCQYNNFLFQLNIFSTLVIKSLAVFDNASRRHSHVP